MRNIFRVITFAILFVSVMYFIGCGSEGSKAEGGGVLGKLPSIAKKAINELEGLQDDMMKAYKKMDEKAYNKAEEKAKEVKKKTDAEMKSIIEANNGIEIPFEQEADKDKFLIKNIKVTGAHFKRSDNEAYINIEATFEAVVDETGTLFTYLRFVDKEGREIKGWAVLMLMASRNKPIKAGETYTLKGAYSCIENLQNADKIIVKSREEWESKKRE